MLAVLLDTAHIVLRGPKGRGWIFTQARDWILSDDVLWPFSFLNICDTLDLGAGRLRARLASRLGGSPGGVSPIDAQSRRHESDADLSW
jgi:hypothetical protein